MSQGDGIIRRHVLRRAGLGKSNVVLAVDLARSECVYGKEDGQLREADSPELTDSI